MAKPIALTIEQEDILSQDYSEVWSQFKLRNLISAGDLEVLQDIDRAPEADQSALFDAQDTGPQVAQMFHKLLTAMGTPAKRANDHIDQLRYVSLWLRVLLNQNPERGLYFYELQEPLKPFVKLLYADFDEHKKEIIGNIAVACGLIVSAAPQYEDDAYHLEHFSKWLNTALTKVAFRQAGLGNEHWLESICLALKNSLKNNKIMGSMLQEEEIPFADLMNRFIVLQTSFQIKYLCGFSLLLVALKEDYKVNISEHSNLCKTMIALISNAKKEKVQRIYLSVIECLADVTIFSEMCVMYSLYPLLERLSESNFKDEDLRELVLTVMEKIRPYVRTMSSMERYKKELSTKNLEWGPVHNEMFWKKNFMYFEQNEFILVKDLCELLNSEDDQTVCVAAHDLGEFARLYPDGRKLVSLFGAKRKLFFLLQESTDEEVKKQCLLATQKILVQSWQSID